jgi:chemotaxis protein CheX
MEAKYLNPFMEAASNALEVMAGISMTRGTPSVQKKFQSLADVSGVIGFAGDVKGAVVLSFPMELAQTVYKALTMDDQDGDTDALADTVGELANMVAGGAKKPLSEMGVNIQISVPSVVAGKDHTITISSSGPCLVVPFHHGDLTFYTQINLNAESST